VFRGNGRTTDRGGVPRGSGTTGDIQWQQNNEIIFADVTFGSAWLKFGVDQVGTEAVATISSVGNDFLWAFLVGFWPGGQKAGEKKCENHITL
jgi:hypothetical protein